MRVWATATWSALMSARWAVPVCGASRNVAHTPKHRSTRGRASTNSSSSGGAVVRRSHQGRHSANSQWGTVDRVADKNSPKGYGLEMGRLGSVLCGDSWPCGQEKLYAACCMLQSSSTTSVRWDHSVLLGVSPAPLAAQKYLLLSYLKLSDSCIERISQQDPCGHVCAGGRWWQGL